MGGDSVAGVASSSCSSKTTACCKADAEDERTVTRLKLSSSPSFSSSSMPLSALQLLEVGDTKAGRAREMEG